MPTTAAFGYGDHPSRLIHVRQPDADEDAPFPVAVLLHGGWWRDSHDAHLMEPIAADLAEAGWLVWNVEYRRTGEDGGGWPETLDDVRAALDVLDTRLTSGAEPGDPDRVVAVGHSAGGHLALLAAAVGSPLTSVVALAPVTDMKRSAAAGLGEGAVADFLGPDAAPELYRESSPLTHPPLECTQLVVHGDADQRIPVEHSRDYAAAATAAGASVEYHEVPGGDHFAVIDPEHEAWQGVRHWMDGLR